MDVKTVCLGVLMFGDASGYEIRKMLEEGPFPHFQEAGFGSIYPALRALSRAGQVTCQEVVQPGRPAKKVYSITPAGRITFARSLLGDTARDRYRSDYLFKLFFAELLDAPTRARLIDEYGALYRDLIGRMKGDLTGVPEGARFVHGLGLAVYRAAVDYIDRNRDRLLSPSIEESTAWSGGEAVK